MNAPTAAERLFREAAARIYATPNLGEAADEIAGDIADEVNLELDHYLPTGWRVAYEEDLDGYAVDDSDILAFGPNGQLYRIEIGDVTLAKVERAPADSDDPAATS